MLFRFIGNMCRRIADRLAPISEPYPRGYPIYGGPFNGQRIPLECNQKTILLTRKAFGSKGHYYYKDSELKDKDCLEQMHKDLLNIGFCGSTTVGMPS